MYVQYHKEIIEKKKKRWRIQPQGCWWMEIRKYSQVKLSSNTQEMDLIFFISNYFPSILLHMCVYVCVPFLLALFLLCKHKTNIRQNNIFFLASFFISFLMVFGCLRVQYANFLQSFQWNFLVLIFFLFAVVAFRWVAQFKRINIFLCIL